MERYRTWTARGIALVVFAFLSTVLHSHPYLTATWLLLEFVETLIALSVFIGIYWIIYRVILRLLGDHQPPPGQLVQVNSFPSLILGAVLGIVAMFAFQDHQHTVQEDVNKWDTASRTMMISYLYESGHTQRARDFVGFQLGQYNDFMQTDHMKQVTGKEIAGFYKTLNQPIPSTFSQKNPLPTDASAADFDMWKHEALGEGPFESAAPPASGH